MQQRSVKRDAATPARTKMSVVAQNPMVVFGGLGELLRLRLLLAPSRWIARSGRGRRDRSCYLLTATSRALLKIALQVIVGVIKSRDESQII